MRFLSNLFGWHERKSDAEEDERRERILREQTERHRKVLERAEVVVAEIRAATERHDPVSVEMGRAQDSVR